MQDVSADTTSTTKQTEEDSTMKTTTNSNDAETQIDTSTTNTQSSRKEEKGVKINVQHNAVDNNATASGSVGITDDDYEEDNPYLYATKGPRR